MGRLSLGAIAAWIGVSLAAPVGAAEISHVSSRGEPGNPFDLDLSIRWDRLQRRAQITREQLPVSPGVIVEGDEMRWSRTTNAVVPRVAIALYKDLEIHFEWPYVLGDDQEWRFGSVGGAPAGGVPPYSTIELNAIDAEGQTCTDQDPGLPGVQCALFPVAPKTPVYHGGKAGDLQAGLAWGIFNDRKDPALPSWLVGLDVTFPTAALYDPAAGRGTDWSSPHNVPGSPGAFGEKVWKWDFYTALSRRIGPIDPYVRAHLTVMSKSSSTYSNCDHAAELSTISVTNPVRQMTRQAATNCADPAWEKDSGAKLPWIAGLTFGTELVPWENAGEQQRVSLDLRIVADYTSAHRFYNELTDATGKLNWTEEYLTMGAFLGVYLQASRYVSLHATASLSTSTPHFVTGESLGRTSSWPALDPSGLLTAVPAEMNPNFDWRYDPPGRRFRVSEVALFQVAFGGVLTF